jgi:dextranase
MFKSSIYITDPSNTEWQNYLSGKINDVYSVYDFDGYHIDQLGSRGTLYDYDGNQADLPSGFYSFIKAMKTARPDKSLVMNAVNRYGTSRIAETGNVDFLYNEVWADDSQYSDIKDIIDKNEVYGNGKLRTVMAAYMNYDKAENKGYFNTPGVILADAVIFALGGSHLELGEHMLGKEYFPNDNLKMDGVLQKAMLNYYDFITAYENLLRDGGPFNSVDIDCINGKMSLAAWPPSSGNVTVLAKSMADGTQIIHLINLSKADSFSWRDLNGTMPEPALIKEASVMLKTTRAVKSIWIASPDIDYGVRKTVDFKQNGNGITFTVPSLKYWDMIVIEY